MSIDAKRIQHHRAPAKRNRLGQLSADSGEHSRREQRLRVLGRQLQGPGQRSFRALPIETQRVVHELFTRSAGDVLDQWFESGPIKAAFGFDAVVGNFASPFTPGSAYVLLHHVFGEINGKRG